MTEKLCNTITELEIWSLSHFSMKNVGNNANCLDSATGRIELSRAVILMLHPQDDQIQAHQSRVSSCLPEFPDGDTIGTARREKGLGSHPKWVDLTRRTLKVTADHNQDDLTDPGPLSEDESATSEGKELSINDTEDPPEPNAQSALSAPCGPTRTQFSRYELREKISALKRY